MPKQPGIIKTLLIAYTVFTSGLLLPTVAGFYKERLGLTSGGALCALVGGGTTAIFLGQSYPLLGMVVSLVLLLAVSYLERFKLDCDYRLDLLVKVIVSVRSFSVRSVTLWFIPVNHQYPAHG